MKHPIKLVICFGVLSLFMACKKKVAPTLSTISDISISTIADTSVTVVGNITNDGGSAVTMRGICYAIKSNPTIEDSVVTDGTGAGPFNIKGRKLIPNTVYYLRAFSKNSVGVAYSNEISFKTPAATDADGNNYTSVTIGNQVWLVENLRTTKYRDGTQISNVTDNLSWAGLIEGAYCNYNNDTSKARTYGRLYNWYAVNDAHKLTPRGWHIPSHSEWNILTDFLGGENIAGGKLKEVGTLHWVTPNTGADNSSGFTALPAGQRNSQGGFSVLNESCFFWLSTETSASEAFISALYSNSVGSLRWTNSKKIQGHSVRCIKD